MPPSSVQLAAPSAFEHWDRSEILIRSQTNWIKVTLGEGCKAALGADVFAEIKSDSTNFECLIGETQRRIDQLKQLAYHARGDEP